jgi:hypothetical protein
MVRHTQIGLFASAIGLLLGPDIANAQQDACRVRIEITLDPEVNDPRDPSFLSSLMGSAGYQLKWVQGDDSISIYDLSGPATDNGCANMIEQIGKSSAVTSVRVVDPQAD